MAFGGVVEDFDGGESVAIGVSGLGQEGAGAPDVFLEGSREGVVAGAGRDEVAGGGFAAFEDVSDELVAVDSERKGLSDAFVVEGWFGYVDSVEVDAAVGGDDELVRLFGFVDGDFAGGDGMGELEFARAEEAFFGLVVGYGQVFDAVEADSFCVPEMGVSCDEDVIVGPPSEESEGAVADVVAFEGPGVVRSSMAPNFSMVALWTGYQVKCICMLRK